MISLMHIWMQSGAVLSNKEPNRLLARSSVVNAMVEGMHRGMQGYRHTSYLSHISHMRYVEKNGHVEKFQISMHDRCGEI